MQKHEGVSSDRSSKTARSQSIHPWAIRRHIPSVVLFIAGVLISGLAWLLLRDHQRQEERLAFERRASEVAASIHRSFEAPLEILHGIRSLFDASKNVDRDEFRTFVHSALERRPDIYALEWFPMVEAPDRATLEARARKDGLKGYRFTHDAGGGRMLPAPQAAEYLPLYYMEPPHPTALGLDLASHPDRVIPAYEARDSGKVTASPRMRLVEDPQDVYSVAFFAPVYLNTDVATVDKRREHFRGVAAAVFRVGPVVERTLKGHDLGDMGFSLSDASAPSETLKTLYTSAPDVNSALAAAETWQRWRGELDVANRSWVLSFVDTPQPSWASAIVLVGGTALSLLLAVGLAGFRVIQALRRQVRVALKLGQYALGEKLGQGGMGEVYLAQHALLRRPTAIKLLHAAPTHEHLQRFEREAQLTSRLTHPNTISVYDYGRTPSGGLYYAMEYLQGLSLEDLVRLDGPQTPARVVFLLRQVCGALHEAHEVGLIHRDIKPANLMLTQRGHIPDFVKVLDFGLVKNAEPNHEPALDVTNERALLGTPTYMSPEAILHGEVDARSDIYALGAVAYYLLTGHHVFDGRTVVQVCAQHVHAEPVPPSKRTEQSIPEKLDALVLRCLAKRPEDRPQTAAELAELLEQVEAGIWSKKDAGEWWESRGVELMERKDSPAEGSRSEPVAGAKVAVDLTRRGTR